MSDHDTLRLLIAPVALGAATDQERTDVERHCATCHECRVELDGLRAAAAELALGVPQVEPPAALKGKVMDRVRAEGVRVAPQPVARAPRRRFAWPAMAGALAALAVGLFAWNLTLRSDDRPSERQIAVVASAAAPDARGVVTIRDDGTAIVRLTGMPGLTGDKGYELWSIRNGVPRSEGFAAQTASFEVVVATADLEGAQALAITPEVRTNVSGPTTEPWVTVPLDGT